MGIQLDVVLDVPNKINPIKKIDNKNLTTKPTIVDCQKIKKLEINIFFHNTNMNFFECCYDVILYYTIF